MILTPYALAVPLPQDRDKLLKSEGGAYSTQSKTWIFEDVDNPARVERIVPLPPFSSENAKFKALKKSLAIYRLALGQPRQEGLIEYLSSFDGKRDEALLQSMQLDLSPQKRIRN